jgi:large subunit ribosomal protein L24
MVVKSWSKVWKSSTDASKQRKYAENAPLHVKHKLMAASLSKELRKEYGVRSVPVKTGDTVKISTGQFKGKTGKITKVCLPRTFIHVEGATVKRADGTDAFYPVHPSNVEITKLDLSDKKRAEKIEKSKGVEK